jgi:type I restriction enzyme S subunit
MVNGWALRPLGDLTDNFDSVRVPVKEADRRPGPYPYYGASGVVDHVDSFLFDGEYLLIAEDGENLRTRNTPVAFLACGKFWVNNHAHIVRGNQQADTRFLMYALAETSINGYLTGSTMPKLTQGNLNRIPVPAPPLAEQKAVVQILSALDDKIELNRRTNETLETVALAIFKSWFVDFDPVRAKLDGRQPPGMDTDTAALFPDGFEHTDLGLVPHGWTVTALGDEVEAIKGLSYKGSGLSDTGIPLHNLNSVYEGGGYKFEGLKHYVGEYKDRHVVCPGDVIVANTEQGHDRLLIGYAAIVPRAFGEFGLFSHHIYRVRPRTSAVATSRFICYLLNSPEIHDLVSGYANGTTVNMLPLDALQSPTFILPPQRLVARFDQLVASIHDRRERFVSENQTLERIRDALLPKLLSGEVRITVAERIVEGVA